MLRKTERRRIEALYLGEVTFVDKWVGVLLDKIEQLSIRDETLVVLMSDHGTQLRDHGSFGKGPNKLHPVQYATKPDDSASRGTE